MANIIPKISSSLFSSLVILFLCSTITLAQSPAQSPAAAPAKSPPKTSKPTGPTDTIKVLLKASHFMSFARLMKAAHLDTQLYGQLNSSMDGVTVFAPTDIAFSNLKPGAVDSLSALQKTEFVQYHILGRFLSLSDFQTLSNPVKTLAGTGSKLSLTITTTGNSVTINTGVVKTSISGTVYTDKQVAIYQVDKVLLPADLFPPATAPAPAKLSAESPVSNVPKDASGATSFGACYNGVALGVVTSMLLL
ncbi:hypothetical protein K2173_016780 [Erythroxylum novogranatense]|uniref:FAS1 domain-containing protein n=1 Tax=Erythroxylum novogranatense TaxID=1862640 RepID=A0AAV8SHX1_9ROSI|nr:hypothetical protein K2173_016780 [Erythroxylum novogranatense]